ncbi:hypothetical protein BpHYR1_052384 [Brachionus plicatilis]|uniref:Uncharacterized protein n=1 Tax=Brachionus plicatilis TaxID=10195 RepID=A0A3M7SX38_BRAPC|nr:hypothetical protein BpHYR1_052384 [Brachionus plicatilis]
MLNNAKTVPSLKTKTNELFYRWLSRPERTEQLKEVIYIIRTSNRIPKQTELKSYKNDHETKSMCKAFMEQLQQGLQPSALPLNSNNSNNSRSKSPPGIQSPPMSPVNRMPQSPKSPRHRHTKTPLLLYEFWLLLLKCEQNNKHKSLHWRTQERSKERSEKREKEKQN